MSMDIGFIILMACIYTTVLILSPTVHQTSCIDGMWPLLLMDDSALDHMSCYRHEMTRVTEREEPFTASFFSKLTVAVRDGKT